MPFSTDVSWPAGLINIFDICRNEPLALENRYNGPYNKLLSYCFEPDSYEFFVAPHFPPGGDLSSRDTVDPANVFLVVFNDEHRPVLIADIKEDGWVSNSHLRFQADEQMRRRYDIILHDCPLPRLWGLSLLGTSLRVYCGDVGTCVVGPEFEARPSGGRILPRDFLEGRWDVDILSPEGFARMKEIVADIVGSPQSRTTR